MTKRQDAAIDALKEAIALGFSDLTQLQTDPNLFILRDTPHFKAIVGAWDEILEAHAAWTEGAARFGVVASSLPRIDVPPPPWASG